MILIKDSRKRKSIAVDVCEGLKTTDLTGHEWRSLVLCVQPKVSPRMAIFKHFFAHKEIDAFIYLLPAPASWAPLGIKGPLSFSPTTPFLCYRLLCAQTGCATSTSSPAWHERHDRLLRPCADRRRMEVGVRAGSDPAPFSRAQIQQHSQTCHGVIVTCCLSPWRWEWGLWSAVE